MVVIKSRSVKCKYCGREVDCNQAFFGEFFRDDAQVGWICDRHVENITTIAHLTFIRNGELNHLYMATKGELRKLLDDQEVSEIRILKAKINMDSIHDRWRPRKKSEAYRRAP